MNNNSLARFDSNGIELIIDTQTEESFASVIGYARMSGLSVSAISQRVKKTNLETATIHTQQGLQGVKLINEDLISDWIVKDNPIIAKQLIKVGVRVFLHNLAGYQVQSSATQPIDPSQAIAQQIQELKEKTNSYEQKTIYIHFIENYFC